MVEAYRLTHRSRAWAALGESDRAVEDARMARDHQPQSPPFAEYHGNIALQVRRPDAAIEAFVDALALEARGAGDAATRARLYRKLGQARERRGQLPEAYDAYKLALKVNPEEAYAKRRVAEMEGR